MQESSLPPRKRGRPRSEPAHRALLEAALREFVARGYEAMSLEAIAAAAGVSKLTLYRRWDSKLALLREVLHELSDETPMEVYQTEILRSRMARLKALIARAYERGELREDLPFTILADMFAGPLFYHLTVLALVEPNQSENVPDLLTQAILRGIAKQKT